ncbi:Ankyrin repeat domain-containing protein 50 [Cladobotryum mycophilum]|uniref:Ankyrin repeat domain-containing protein 50 n=1 Tax=Cladobotryum mycophilum TaxID=491253 RepID=A0ABR0SP97_9HYPO
MARYLLIIYALAIAGARADDLSDFSNNLASDLGPLLSLFGEAITRQYLSESTSFLDYFIFSMVPIGILTTVVSVIRVCGSPSLRAFIGRAQEGEGAIEAELCTSTSRDVCELFNRGGITRVLGRPDILELVYLPQHSDPSARLKLFRHETSKNYAPGIFIAGTVALCFGMWSCAALIGQTTHELHYQRSQKSSERLYWIQPGPQVIGDQSFDPFAYSDNEDQLMTWTSSIKDFENKFQVHTFFAVLLVLLGYIAQFIGLRGMSAWVSIAQLGITLIMSCLRCVLRMKRLTSDNNSLSNFPDLVTGHELDWLAFEITRHDSLRRDSSNDPKSHSQIVSWHVTGQPQKANEVETKAFQEAQDSSTQSPSPYDSKDSADCGPAASPIEHCATGEPLVDYRQLFLNRVRLAHLTGHFHFETMEPDNYQIWKDMRVNVRAKSKQLASAICQAAATLLEHQKRSIKLVIKAAIPGESFGQKDQLVHVTIKPPADHTQITWSLDSAQLEAILGLWLWSLISGDSSPSNFHKENHYSLNRNPKTEVMRIIFAATGDGNGNHHTDVDMEMSFWLGTQNIEYPSKSLVIHDDYKYSLFDLWLSSDANSLERFVDANHPNQPERSKSSPQHFRRFCGWGLVYELLNAQTFKHIEVKAFKIDLKEYSLLDICAQDLFITLIRSLSNFKRRNLDKTTVVESDGTIRLENPAITGLTNAFISNGLGTYLDAVTCIIPPLRTLIRPSNDDLLVSLKKAGVRYRQGSEWERAETVLQWACQYFFSSLSEKAELDESGYFMRSLRALGELYRWSLSQAADDARRKFSQDGVQWMDRAYGNTNVIVTSYRDIIRRICDHHMGHKGSQDRASNENSLTSAIKDKRRTDALYDLSFIKTGDFTSLLLRNAFPLAVRNDWDEVMDAILEMKGSPNTQDEEGRTAISHCAEVGHQWHLRRLISIGAQVDLADKRKQSPLYWAISVGSEVVIRILLDTQQVDLNRLAEDDSSLVSIAVERGLTNAVGWLVDSGINADLPDARGDTPLSLAAKRGYIAITERLLNNGATIDQPDARGDTPLSLAVKGGYVAIVEQLLNNGATVDQLDARGDTPLSLAVKGGYIAIIERLLNNGATIDHQDSRGDTPLSLAVKGGYVAITEQLLNNGATIDHPDSRGATPLVLAIQMQHKQTVQVLLDKGAKIEINYCGLTPFWIAVRLKNYELTEMLLNRGANIETKTDGKRLLAWAIKWNEEALVRQLVDNGAFIEERDGNGNTALLVAIKHHRKDLVLQLLEKDALIDIHNENGETALHLGARSGQSEIVQQLLEKGAAIEAKNRWGDTALIKAAYRGEANVVQLLIDKGADIEAKNNRGDTALIRAAYAGMVDVGEVGDVIRLLIDKGADIEAKDENGSTALMEAAKCDRTIPIQLLLGKGADIEAKDNDGSAALIQAAYWGKANVIQLLLDKGADIEAKDKWGDTALIKAASSGNTETIRLLIDKGADIEAKDENGSTALMEAAKWDRTKAVQLLLEKGADEAVKDRDGRTYHNHMEEYDWWS